MKLIFKPVDRNTADLFPACVQDYLPDDHMARFVVEVVDQLNIDAFTKAYRGVGSKAWHPAMMLSLLFYGYSTGVFSSRKLEKATYDSVAFRYICANQHPDHDSINTFRKRFGSQISELFVQILLIAKESGWLNLGHVSLDGTKIKANASKHKALSYQYACKLEVQLQEEVAELLKLAEQADSSDLPEEFSIPEELKRREDRLAVIADAKAEIERRAEERDQRERAEYEEKVARHEARNKAGKAPKEPEPGPREKDQTNLTDKESRIMPASSGGFEQAYNAQASVDIDSGLIITRHVTQATNDKQEVEPTLAALEELEPVLGKPEGLLADTGYFSETNVNAVDAGGITPYIAMERDAHNRRLQERFKPDAPMPEGDDVTALQLMCWCLQTKAGRAIYGRRKSTIEPTFGIVKEVMGYRQFLVRGHEAVSAEWDLLCLAFNLKRIFTLKQENDEKLLFILCFSMLRALYAAHIVRILTTMPIWEGSLRGAQFAAGRYTATIWRAMCRKSESPTDS